MTTPPPADFTALVARMRAAQRKWFRTRDRQALEESKRLERLVNRMLADMDGRPTLFDRATSP